MPQFFPTFPSSSLPFPHPSHVAVHLTGPVVRTLSLWVWIAVTMAFRVFIGIAWIAAIALPTLFLSINYIKIAARLRTVE